MKRVLMKAGAVALIVLAIIAVVLIRNNIKNSNALKAEVEQGVSEVKKLEGVEVAEVEQVLDSIAEREAAEAAAAAAAAGETVEKTLKERFDGAMVLGDSQALALTAYDVLDESEVVGKIGVGVRFADEHIEKAVSMNPSVVFMTYGMNDLGIYGTAEEFATAYGEKLEKLKTGLPDARIYVTSIFAANKAAIAREPHLANSGAFNEALKKKAEELGAVYIDCSSLELAENYAGDGAHFNVDVYPQWAEMMAAAAGL